MHYYEFYCPIFVRKIAATLENRAYFKNSLKSTKYLDKKTKDFLIKFIQNFQQV